MSCDAEIQTKEDFTSKMVPQSFVFILWGREWNHSKTFRVFTQKPTIPWKAWISTEDRKSRQNRVLYAENRNRI